MYQNPSTVLECLVTTANITAQCLLAVVALGGGAPSCRTIRSNEASSMTTGLVTGKGEGGRGWCEGQGRRRGKD